MKVECIDDSFRPADIPLSKWITKGEVYTELKRYKGLNGVEIVEIEEIDLKPFPPYKGFAASRFKEPTEQEIELYRAEHGVYS